MKMMSQINRFIPRCNFLSYSAMRFYSRGDKISGRSDPFGDSSSMNLKNMIKDNHDDDDDKTGNDKSSCDHSVHDKSDNSAVRGDFVRDQSNYDVVIIGGGMVGGTLASTLLNSKYTQDLKIAILDPSLKHVMSHEFDQEQTNTIPGIRCSAISPTSAKLFQRIGLAKNVLEHETSCAFTDMHVWDEAIPKGVIRFSSKSDSHDQYTSLKNDSSDSPSSKPLGYMIDNHVLVYYLFQQLKQDIIQNGNDRLTFLSEKVQKIDLNQERQSLYINHWNQLLGKDHRKDMQMKNHTSSSHAIIHLANGEKISSKLIIAADGAQSQSREQLGFRTLGWSYGQHAVVCTVELETSHNQIAYQRFLKTGPIALLPLMNHLSSSEQHQSKMISNIVWSTEIEHAKYLMQLPADEFTRALNLAFQSHKPYGSNSSEGSPLHVLSEVIAGFANFPKGSQKVSDDLISTSAISVQVPKIRNILNDGKRGSFPLKRLHALDYVKPRIALIGDAAHVCHPLAGQGVNMGFSDVIQLTKTLQFALKSGTDIGNPILLKKMYEEPQFKRNEAMLAILESVQKAFSFGGTIPAFMRGVGMMAIDKYAPQALKNQMISIASGYSVDLTGIGRNDRPMKT